MQPSLIDLAEWIDRFGFDLIGSDTSAEREPSSEGWKFSVATEYDARTPTPPRMLQ